jgi:mono/diheme cytochrome c family protein
VTPARAALGVAVIVLATTPAAPAQVAGPDPGRRVYLEQCAICHGEHGDGRGHAAPHFATPPRDLTSGRYKIRSRGSGQLPTDDDLVRTIRRGLPGTGMVPQDHLGEAELRAVIAFI